MSQSKQIHEPYIPLTVSKERFQQALEVIARIPTDPTRKVKPDERLVRAVQAIWAYKPESPQHSVCGQKKNT